MQTEEPVACAIPLSTPTPASLGKSTTLVRYCNYSLTVTLLILSAGCSTWSSSTSDSSLSSWSPKQWFKKEYQEPASVAAIWSPDTATTAGQPTMRGFGGRIYFYNQRSQAVPVEGDLIIHGYVTTPGMQDLSTVHSDKRFVFSSEQLTTHFSPSQIGASYSIWVPWDVEGGFREEITLIATFKSKQGSVVQGTPAKLFLPGKSRIESEVVDSSVQTRTVSYVTDAIPTHPGPNVFNAPMTRTTTIEIPDTAPLSRAKRVAVETYPVSKTQASVQSPATLPTSIPPATPPQPPVIPSLPSGGWTAPSNWTPPSNLQNSARDRSAQLQSLVPPRS
jgi:hypothetical protein